MVKKEWKEEFLLIIYMMCKIWNKVKNYFKGVVLWEILFMKNYFIIYCIIIFVVFFLYIIVLVRFFEVGV